MRASAGVYTATITRLSPTGPYVVAPRIDAVGEFGPCYAVEAPTAYAAGDTVLVAFLEGSPDEVAIVGRLP